MARAGKSLLGSSGPRAADNLGRGQKLRAAAGQRAALAGALPENLLTRCRNWGPHEDRLGHELKSSARASLVRFAPGDRTQRPTSRFVGSGPSADAQVFGCHQPTIAPTKHATATNIWMPICVQYRIGAVSL